MQSHCFAPLTRTARMATPATHLVLRPTPASCCRPPSSPQAPLKLRHSIGCAPIIAAVAENGVSALQSQALPAATAIATTTALATSYHNDVERILFTEDMLQQRITEMGHQLAADYATRSPLVLGV
jgi:hypothetical protein